MSCCWGCVCTLKLYYQEKILVCASALGNKALLTCSKYVYIGKEKVNAPKKKRKVASLWAWQCLIACKERESLVTANALIKVTSRGGQIFFDSPFPPFQRERQDTSVWVILTLFLLYWLSQSRTHSLFPWPCEMLRPCVLCVCDWGLLNKSASCHNTLPPLR